MNLSVFTAVFQGLGSFEFDVTSTQIKNRNANFSLPPNISVTDICTLSGVIFGGNNAGNSTAADIQLPRGKEEEKLLYPVILPSIPAGYNYVFFTECHPLPPSSSIAFITRSTIMEAPSSTISPTISSPSPSGDPTAIIAGIGLWSVNNVPHRNILYKMSCFHILSCACAHHYDSYDLHWCYCYHLSYQTKEQRYDMHYVYIPYCIPQISSCISVVVDVPLKRNEAYATVSGVSMQRNEAYSVVVPLQRNEAYNSVVRPANALNTQTSPEYEITHVE